MSFLSIENMSLRRVWLLFALFASGLFASSVMALTAPAAGSFAFDMYQVGVVDTLQGPIGFVGAVLLMVWSAIKITTNWMGAVAGLLGSIALINAESLVTSMGMIV